MTRWKAAAIHLSISAVVAAAVGAMLYFMWFPHPYFVAAGASMLFMLLMGVDVGIGPLLTLIVYSPTKKKSAIHFDLAVIGLVQTIAFVYGASVIWQARPVFVVGEVDRLILVTAKEISREDLAKGKFADARSISWVGPRLVGTLPPSGPDAFDIIASAMKGGKDIDNLPEFFVPYSAVAQDLLKRAHPVEGLLGLSQHQQQEVQHLRSEAVAQGHDLAFLPLEHGDDFFTAIVRSDNAQPVTVLGIDPWDSGSLKK